MVKTTVYLDEETVARLKQLSEAQQRPQAEIIRTILRDGTRPERPRVSPNWGKFSSGTGDLSTRRKEIFKELVEAKYKKWHSS